jgi:cobalt-zinc-cadmium efflux system outer membrane protein
MRSAHAALAAALFVPALAWGQEAPSAGFITEAEFLEIAEEAPPLRALGEELGIARADALASRALRNPRFSASREAPEDATEQLDLTLSWEPPRPDRRRLAVAAADAGVNAAGTRLQIGRLGVRRSMRESYARWALAAERTSLAAAFAERLASLARVQEQRAVAGEISGLDARRMALAAADAKTRLAHSESEVLSARADALAWRPDIAPGLRPVLPDLPLPPAMDASHPEVTALEAELMAARIERDLAGRVLGLPEIVGGWQRQRVDGGITAEGPLVGLEWPLPLFDRGRADRARAEARLDALEARLELTRVTLQARREGALAVYERLRAAAVEAAAAADDAEPVVIAVTASFRLGEASLTDLLETLRAASTARDQAIELRGAALEAHRELEGLAGAPTVTPDANDGPAPDERSPREGAL